MKLLKKLAHFTPLNDADYLCTIFCSQKTCSVKSNIAQSLNNNSFSVKRA